MVNKETHREVRMQTIKEHIKNKQFSSVYLLYGQEDYLKKLYRDKLKKGILSPEDTMNYSYFEGKNLDIGEVQSIADTVPFFAEHRLIIIENSGLFKSQSDFVDYIPNIPESAVLIFVEHEVDKRNRMYKAVKKYGTVSEMNGLSERDLKLWVATLLKKNGKKITELNITYLLQKTGGDMKNLENELEKIICYGMEQEEITRDIIDEVCVEQTEGRIFQMIDAIGMRNQDEALRLYYDLITVREKPMSILFLLVRHFNILLQVKELGRIGTPNGEIASKVGIPPFTVKKYIQQAKNFKNAEIKQCLERCVKVEQGIKTGLLLEQIGVELLIVEFSQRPQK